jgi:lactoylglutathione lyase
MNMRFGYAIAYVQNVEATIAFWERAFGLERRMVVESGEYGELDTGATRLGFAAEWMATEFGVAMRPNRPEETPTFEFALVTDDVQAGFAKAVAAGATPMREPAEKPWGQVVGYVRDPNGILVEICSPLPD